MSDTEFLLPLALGSLVSTVVLYLVIRTAVLSALRLHAKTQNSSPEYATVGKRHRKPSGQDPQNWT
jgi:hypothetical protein